MGDILFHLSVAVMHRSFLILLVLVFCDFGVTRKFCPRERNGDKCRAKDNAFKCGVFFYNLLDNGGYQYLAELPNALKKTKKEDWQEILGEDIALSTFNTSVICDKNLLTNKAEETVGD